MYHRRLTRFSRARGEEMRKLARNLGTAAAVAAAPLAGAPPALAAGDGNPAGGAPTGDVVLASAGAIVLSVLLLTVGQAHRSGRLRLLERAGDWCERRWGLPGWSSLPGAISLVALLVALVGMYWDISLHIDQGRDPGPLANPAHYLILVGLYGVLVAGVLSIVLAGTEQPARTAIHIGGEWWAPVGGAMMAACGAFALTGFPLDDMWHRLF